MAMLSQDLGKFFLLAQKQGRRRLVSQLRQLTALARVHEVQTTRGVVVSCLRHPRPPRRFMDEGKFVPDKIIFEVLVAAVERVKRRGKHVMLDGFPR